MTTPASDFKGIKSLRGIPAFASYARTKMVADAEFWRREAAHGTGIMRTLAVAVVEIGGDAV